MIYRNIFFYNNGFTAGKGEVILQYTGRIYTNAKSLKNFKTLYDASQDLLISCIDCAKNKYKSFKKIKSDK